MECGICLYNITNSCHGSCCHHYCFHCLIQWCKINNKCPKCRCIINEIMLDNEFDEILGRLKQIRDCDIDIDIMVRGNSIIDEIDQMLKIHICYDDNLPKNMNLCITLANNNGPGVIIKNAEKHGRAYHYGLRKNDIIVYINNVPCINHRQAIDIINTYDNSRKPIVYAIIRH